MQLILCGGGDGKQNTQANQRLNEIIDHTRPILYIPLAMDEKVHSYDRCYEWIKGELRNVDIPSIEMVRTFEELASKDLEKYAALFIGGGNTYKLLLGLKSTKAFANIKNYLNNNGIIIGGSAGAVIFGYDINIISSMDPNDVNLIDTKGFDMLSGISIFPHYTNKKSTLTEQENEKRLINFTNSIINFSKTVGEVFAIPEEDAIYVNDNSIEFLGTRPYFIFKNGIMEKYEIENNKQNKKMIQKMFFQTIFLISNKVSCDSVINYLKYHYADGTTNGTGKNRVSASEYKIANQDKIDIINKELNQSPIPEKAIDRFILKGNLSNTSIDTLLYGVKDDFIWIKKEDIRKSILSKKDTYSTAVHFVSLTVQPLDRCLNKNEKYDRKRFCVQIKWYNLADDIIEFMNNKKLEKPDYYTGTSKLTT